MTLLSPRFLRSTLLVTFSTFLAFTAIACGKSTTDDDALVIVDDPDTGEHPDDTSDTPDEELPPEEEYHTGENCSDDEQCGPNMVCEHHFLGGYCTALECDNESCQDDSKCQVLTDGTSTCLRICESNDDCYEGQFCETYLDGSFCIAEFYPNPTARFEQTEQKLELICNAEATGERGEFGNNYAMRFTLSDNVDSFVVVPVVRAGRLAPVSLATPNHEIDLANDYRHHNVRITDMLFSSYQNVGIFGEINFDWPIQVPYAPQYSEYVVPGGDYTLVMSADQEAPCLFVVESTDGRRLDLNFYFVGLEDLHARNAADDPDFIEVIAKLKEIFSQADIELGKIRYYDVDESVASRYSVIRNQMDMHRLTAFGTHPNDTRDGHLSVDVFLVHNIQISGGGQVLGMSAGIPGAPGLHGNARNGLVFRSVDIGAANHHVGHIIAHELGHYLGLRHTTEVLHGMNHPQADSFDAMVGTTDPIEDTPVCDSVQTQGFQCPDFRNLMFPSAPPPQMTNFKPVITQGQGQILRENPLIK